MVGSARCAVRHALKELHDSVKTKYIDMVYAENSEDVCKKRKAFLAKWWLRCRGVADSLEAAGERLCTFLRYPRQRWKSLRTTNAIERLHEKFKRWVKTQCALPNAETSAMLFWALMATGADHHAPRQWKASTRLCAGQATDLPRRRIEQPS